LSRLETRPGALFESALLKDDKWIVGLSHTLNQKHYGKTSAEYSTSNFLDV